MIDGWDVHAARRVAEHRATEVRDRSTGLLDSEKERQSQVDGVARGFEPEPELRFNVLRLDQLRPPANLLFHEALAVVAVVFHDGETKLDRDQVAGVSELVVDPRVRSESAVAESSAAQRLVER